MQLAPEDPAVSPAETSWSTTVARYKEPSLAKSLWQISNTFVPFCAIWYAMYLSLSYSYWLTLALAVLAAGFRVRIFIIQHDCGHRAFFRSARANDILGFVCGVITFTPYWHWRRTHALHHATSGNLDQRGFGDIDTLTVEEYLSRSPLGPIEYRFYRNPLVLFIFGACLYFFFRHRVTLGVPRDWKKERRSIHWTNLALLGVLAVAWATIGVRAFLLIDVPIVALGAIVGTWMFYVQHQYEEAYWDHDDKWNYARAAIEGSSYYHLPRVLQWFTGNIGFHHIHHLNSRIPNYHLPACYREEPGFRQVVTLTLWRSLKCISMKLWDEEQRRMITFRELANRQAAA